MEVSLLPNIKKKKGKKKEAALPPALERIMGYAGSDMSEEEVSAAGACTAREMLVEGVRLSAHAFAWWHTLAGGERA